MIWIVYVTNLLTIAIALYLWAELRQRDRHLEWVDERDQGVAHLFQKVAEAKVIPMTNPLDGMKQHGMITRNAVTPFYLNEMDERLTHAQGFLRRALDSAKDLERWESSNPPPPVSRWKERKATVGKPIPTPEPRRPDYHSTVVDEAVARVEAKKPPEIGKGAFGPEVDR